jgi:catabolite regulation protein CreA
LPCLKKGPGGDEDSEYDTANNSQIYLCHMNPFPEEMAKPALSAIPCTSMTE